MFPFFFIPDSPPPLPYTRSTFHLIQNTEKVWIAEQKAAAEKKRMLELQKQLTEERQVMELKQLQKDAGIHRYSLLLVLPLLGLIKMSSLTTNTRTHQTQFRSFRLDVRGPRL